MSAPEESLTARLQADLTAAMKSRDQVTTATIRMLRTAITNAEVAGDAAVSLTDEQVVAVLLSEAKKRAESAEIYDQAGRADSAARERAELAVIERYLPAAMSDEELGSIVGEELAVATSAGVEGPRAMGVVVKAVRERVGAAADGSRVAAAVKSALGI